MCVAMNVLMYIRGSLETYQTKAAMVKTELICGVALVNLYLES